MPLKQVVLGILVLVLLIGTAGALDLSPSYMDNYPGWLVANGVDNVTVTAVAVQKGTPDQVVPDANVTFWVYEGSTALGTITPAKPTSVKTGADGKATAVFKVNKKSGTAIINATISVFDGMTWVPADVSTTLRIDHDTPQKVSYSAPTAMQAGALTTITISLKDAWLNPVDSNNVVESVTLFMTSADGAGFQDGASYVGSKSYPVDANGNVTATLRAPTTAPQDVIIQMNPIGYIDPAPPLWIHVTAAPDPWYISQTVASPGPNLPADGKTYSAIRYAAFDRYNNLVPGVTLYVTSTDGTNLALPTNSGGYLYLSIKPKDVTGIYTYNVSVPVNSSVVCLGTPGTGTIGHCSQSLNYVNTTPVDMLFFANPQTMASWEITDSGGNHPSAAVMARVVDSLGNPVSGQTVTFSVGTPTYSDLAGATTPGPDISPKTVSVDGADGYAKAVFSPGTFDGTNATASGNVTITATWHNSTHTVTRNLEMYWKNYPYISTASEGDCSNAQVGDKINITIQLYGDGAALRPKPIDVILLNDRSGSMLTGVPDRMVSAKQANSIFFSQLNSGTDKVGLLSFAGAGVAQLAPIYVPASNQWNWQNVYASGCWVKNDDGTSSSCSWNTGASGDCPGCSRSGSSPYLNAFSNYCTTYVHHQYVVANYNNGLPMDYNAGNTHEDLTFGSHTQSEVDTALKTIVPSGGTPTREGIYQAVNMLPAATSSRVRAIVLLTDGDYNTGGDPEANATSPGCVWSAATYADGTTLPTSMSVLDYAKAKEVKVYPIGLSVSSCYNTTLARYANATGGKYFYASSPGDLVGIYTAIAGDLRETAGGSTKVSVDFGKVKVDNSTYDLKDRMTYEYASGTSTLINKTYWDAKMGTTTQLEKYTRDDTDNWTAQKLEFDVGEINLNQTWRATFRLNLTKAGSYNLFGPESSNITFKDAISGNTQKGFIPPKYCFVLAQKAPKGFGTQYLQVDNLTGTYGATNRNVWTFKWNTTYSGDDGISELLRYRIDGQSVYKNVQAVSITSPPVFEYASDPVTMTVSDDTFWPPGQCARFEVTAYAQNATNSAVTAENVYLCKDKPADMVYIKLN